MATFWFRMYSEVLEDPKVQRLSAENFRYWVNILCVVSRQNTPKLPAVDDLAFMLRVSEKTASRVIEELVSANLLDVTDSGIEPHNWQKRQYKSDVSTERVKRYRAKNGTLHETDVKRFSNGEGNVNVTPPDTDTDTDTDTETASSSPRTPACPHEAILTLYHETLPNLTRHTVWNEPRRRNLQARWRESTKRQTLDWWKTFFGHVAASDFLMGRTQSRDGRPPFQADLEWLTKPGNFAKVVEGKYHQ